MTYRHGQKLKARWKGEPGLAKLAREEDAPYPPSGATDEDLALINALPQVLRPHTPETCYVREVLAANDQLMWNGQRIEPAGVGMIASLAASGAVPLMANHDTYNGTGALPLGRVFRGRTEKRADVLWARLGVMFPVTDATTEMVERMDGGAIGEASVQILYGELECSICNTDMWKCAHVPGEAYDGKTAEGIIRGVSDFLELSMVWAGMAKGTQWLMAASRGAEAAETEEMLLSRSCMQRYFKAGNKLDKQLARLDRLFVKK